MRRVDTRHTPLPLPSPFLTMAVVMSSIRVVAPVQGARISARRTTAAAAKVSAPPPPPTHVRAPIFFLPFVDRML